MLIMQFNNAVKKYKTQRIPYGNCYGCFQSNPR